MAKFRPLTLCAALVLAWGAHAQSLSLTPPAPAAAKPQGSSVDYIVVFVNQEVVTNSDVLERIRMVQADAARAGNKLPPEKELREQAIQNLIDERLQISQAKEQGFRLDDAELDREIANIAENNKLTLPQLKEILAKDGVDFQRYRRNIRDEILSNRIRFKEVNARIKVTDTELEDQLEMDRRLAQRFNVAQILLLTPDSLSTEQLRAKQGLAQDLLARARRGENFDQLVTQYSEGKKTEGGALGLRPAEQLPEEFLPALAGLKSGDMATSVVRSLAGFHVIKLLEFKDPNNGVVVQRHARHILLKAEKGQAESQAAQRLSQVRGRIQKGADFAQLAKEMSADTGSAQQGGDLGWASPGMFVPEFEAALSQLKPGQISEPFSTTYGVHIVQLLETREQTLSIREQKDRLRGKLRESRYENAVREWMQELRAKAYIDRRDNS